MHERTHLDLCSGIGGFAIAAGRCGVRTVAFAELDGLAARWLADFWPGVPNLGDVRGRPRRLSPWLLTCGLPCQPFSRLGKRRGTGDDRHLWPAVARWVKANRPTWCLFENTPDFTTLALDGVSSDLERLGYASWPLIVPAAAVGAHHLRARVWLVAHARRQRRQGPFLQKHLEAADTAGRLGDSGRWPAEPGVGCLVHGLPGRTLAVRAYGNAIHPAVAQEVIRSMIEAES